MTRHRADLEICNFVCAKSLGRLLVILLRMFFLSNIRRCSTSQLFLEAFAPIKATHHFLLLSIFCQHSLNRHYCSWLAADPVSKLQSRISNFFIHRRVTKWLPIRFRELRWLDIFLERDLIPNNQRRHLNQKSGQITEESVSGNHSTIAWRVESTLSSGSRGNEHGVQNIRS